MPGALAYLREHRKRTLGDQTIDLGAITEYVYVGTPSHDPPYTTSGSADHIAGSLLQFAAMGVNHVQVRFKARDCDELVDQMAAFGTAVAPLLG